MIPLWLGLIEMGYDGLPKRHVALHIPTHRVVQQSQKAPTLIPLLICTEIRGLPASTSAILVLTLSSMREEIHDKERELVKTGRCLARRGGEWWDWWRPVLRRVTGTDGASAVGGSCWRANCGCSQVTTAAYYRLGSIQATHKEINKLILHPCSMHTTDTVQHCPHLTMQ